MTALMLSQRGEIRLGFRCNARCGFCYYQDLLDNPKDKEPTTEQLLSRVRALRRAGATEIEFTGGEPTIRPDLIELAAFAKQLGFVNISLITNGLRLASARYAAELVAAGVNDFLFSIHGHTKEVHDAHTRIPGSFAKILQAVGNVQSLGKRCRSSTVVTGQNYLHIEATVGMLTGLQMDCIHLAVFSPVAQATDTDHGMAVKYSDAAASIKAAIDRHQDHLPSLSVKYIPFCFMQGYEKYVMNLYQQSFDPDDWNYYYSNKIRRADSWLKRFAFDSLVATAALFAKNYSVPMRYGWAGLKVFGLTRIVELVRKRRPAACRKCSYNIVCDGVWKDYIARFGDAEIAPVSGPKITHPAWCYELARSRSPGVPVTSRFVARQSGTQAGSLRELTTAP